MASMPDAWIAAVRAAHFGATIVLFGQFAFVLAVAPGREPARRWLGWSAVAAIVSATAWLGLEAISMSGLPASEALSASTLGVVATQTQFGRVWLGRVVVCAALAALLPAARRRAVQWPGAALAALLLISLAAMGHGGSGRGVAGLVHLGADATHLLAAGAWLGALVPLVLMLARARRTGDADAMRLAAEATRRFSALGIIGMALIVLSGVVNAWDMLPGLEALVDQRYGRLLLAKLLLFMAILGYAAVNRQVLAPRLLAPDAGPLALRRLHRNALFECVLGFGIIAIVGELGITVPGPH